MHANLAILPSPITIAVSSINGRWAWGDQRSHLDSLRAGLHPLAVTDDVERLS
jgi:hypothetical protein